MCLAPPPGSTDPGTSTSTTTTQPPPDQSIGIRIKLDGDYNETVAGQEEKFKEAVIDKIAEIMGVSPDRIRDMVVKPGNYAILLAAIVCVKEAERC